MTDRPTRLTDDQLRELRSQFLDHHYLVEDSFRDVVEECIRRGRAYDDSAAMARAWGETMNLDVQGLVDSIMAAKDQP